MLRPVFAFLTLCLAAFLLAPTVASVHQKVEDLDFDRDTGINLFKWYDEPTPTVPFPDCGGGDRRLYSEVVVWPAKIRKDEAFTLQGVVQSEEDGRRGVGSIEIDIFLNKTKQEPGILLGRVESSPNGVALLTTSIPFDLQAQHYHIVMHAKQKRINCVTYKEHWSDPEVDVVSKTQIAWDSVAHPVAGREINVTGRVLDVVGGPVKNATLNVTLAGKTRMLVTDDAGGFRVNHTPKAAGELTAVAEYKGNAFYEPTKNETRFSILEEEFVMDSTPLGVRSQAVTLAGHVYVAEAVRQPTVTLAFDGMNATTCDGCPADRSFTTDLASDGSFSLTFTVPPSESPGIYALRVSGGGLKKTYTSNFTLDVQPVLNLSAEGTGLFTRGYRAQATLTDEIGRPLAGVPLAVLGPHGWESNATNASGTIGLAGQATCGMAPFSAHYNGTDRLRPATATSEAGVCGFLAYIPPWLLAVPWWIWPIVALAAFVAWQMARGWRQRYAPIISGGPALTLTFTEPADEAAGYAGIGEAVIATAFLEAPLPDGHRLRMGAHRQTGETPIDAELRAHLRLVPDKLGDVAIRAEIVDEKGRIVTRRTATLHVVRYAQEIERRYLAFRATTGASDAVTPREFERWLHERAPALDPEGARRLVRVFEEADYSPRAAGRADLAVYLAAERGMTEVAPDATLA